MQSSTLQPHGVHPIAKSLILGFTAAHRTLRGGLYLALLHAPAQVLAAVVYSVQGMSGSIPGQGNEINQTLLALISSAIGLALALAVFFVFPLIQGGILGQVRDRLQSPDNAPASFGSHARGNYVRLLGSQAVLALFMIAFIAPVAVLGAILTIQTVGDIATVPADLDSPIQTNPQQLQRQILSNPVMIGVLVLVSVLTSAIVAIYWVANCSLTTGTKGVIDAWKTSLAFCRENFLAVFVLWVLNLLASAVMTPLGLVGQVGLITNPWGLILIALAYSALIGYWGLILSGLSMSIYLDRRRTAGQFTRRPML